MKYCSVIIIFCTLATYVYAQKIATFQFSLIIDNLQSYKDFTKELNIFKDQKFEELKSEEKLLLNKQKEIEDSKLLLSEIKYLSKISQFNEEKKVFETKVNKFNNYLKETIEINEKEIFDEIVKIVNKIALNNNIDIILSDDQYFISSDKIDISGLIYNKLNDLNIKFELKDYE